MKLAKCPFSLLRIKTRNRCSDSRVKHFSCDLFGSDSIDSCKNEKCFCSPNGVFVSGDGNSSGGVYVPTMCETQLVLLSMQVESITHYIIVTRV